MQQPFKCYTSFAKIVKGGNYKNKGKSRSNPVLLIWFTEWKLGYAVVILSSF